MQERERLGSRLGFILLSAGCAIGIGNVWKFPYMVGQYGGGLFVIIYLIFLVIMGVPVMTMELAMGRAGQKSPAKLYQSLTAQAQGKKVDENGRLPLSKTKWGAHGYVSFVGNILLMMFYTVVAGWMLQYFVKMAKGDFVGLENTAVDGQFTDMLSNAPMQILFTGIVIAIATVVCFFGVKKGLETVTKYMMVALLIIMVVLAVNGFFMAEAGKGLKFYFVPDFDAMRENGIGFFNVVAGAMSQAFFTLSLGMGSMAIFGSYINKDRSLLGESITIASLDTFVAIVSGLIIFPALFTYGNGEIAAGPPLIFQVLPNIFTNMTGGRIWGSLFFVFLSFAALSTVFAVFENIIACLQDVTNFNRKKATIIVGVGIFILAIPAVLGYNAIPTFNIFTKTGQTVLDLEDFIVSNLILPIGSLIFVLFCTLKKGWGYENFIEEANAGKGLKVKPWMGKYMKYVLPVLMSLFIVVSILTFFGVL